MKTIVNFILDQSGSMGVTRDATIEGFNEYLSALKKDMKKGDQILFSLTLFDHNVMTKYVAVPIEKVQPLTRKTYQPAGMTALYDAVVETVEKAHDAFEELKGRKRALVTIMTDGGENSSKEHDEGCVADLIKKLTDEDWTFTFLGANQDSWATTQRWGIASANVANYSNQNNAQVRSAFRNLGESTAFYAMSASASADNFFNGKKDLSNDA